MRVLTRLTGFFPTAGLLLLLTATSVSLSGQAMAQQSDALSGAEMMSGDPTREDSGAGVPTGRHENLHVKGRRKLPPGYQDAPSMDILHGPDPEHAQHVTRDAVTGADLSRFGSAYQDSGPTGSGSLGDSTGNGWVAPR
ncbi:hypothetical protein EDC15_104179 [Acetobacter aceti NBRC 14818]|uniref:Uncharacterized protein n=2 Tax=Acetobacter aceti TaxID=435 RepID=A0A6S6PH68_ACEAC|nr:hypothetical protein [Acetobacter aceti]TCS34234.1 hypothetical protein EDC15_104179 [Acetobacter aceti NBRC 14818]BCI66613.1 hypothetical protein AAJCM20276_12370 [Acetobacter aceti]BCK75480.1 hypothetical protein EMQ_1086 [Acetobacter aceti NBRC 14818]GAN58733.1 hypothetical protein Abac_063_068 [Acetobacter aceti NBRC 14818]